MYEEFRVDDKDNILKLILEEEGDTSDASTYNFIKRRRKILGHLKDFKFNFRAKQNAKHMWRTNRLAMQKGIDRFHKSTAGKRFHRKLNTFLQDRSPLLGQSSESILTDDLVSLRSAQTHLDIESKYFIHDLDEHLSFDLFYDTVSEMLDDVIKKVRNNECLDDDEKDMLNVIQTRQTSSSNESNE